MNQQLQAVQFNEELLAEREVNINKLARGVEEISELFQDMSILVSQQGELIDNIETNINNSLSHVYKANSQLRKAEKISIKKRIRFLYLGCIVVLVVMIVIIVLVNYNVSTLFFK